MLPIKLVVHKKEIELLFDIEVIIRAKRNFVFFKQKVTDNEVQLAYLEGKPLYSDQAIKITDHLSYGEIHRSEEILSTNSNIVNSSSDRLEFTNIVLDENGPCFYGHKLSAGTQSAVFIPWNKSPNSNIAIYNNRFNALISSLSNDLDMENNIYRASYVQSMVNGELKTEIYKEEPLFKEASYFDIDPSTYMLDTSKPVYTKERLNNGIYRYTVYGLSSSDTLYYREDSQTLHNRISIARNVNSNYAWPIVLKGESSLIASDNEPRVVSWETEDPVFFPYYPYTTNKHLATVLNKDTLLMPDSNIVIRPEENLHITITVIRDGELLFAKTTKPYLINKYIQGSFIKKNVKVYEKFLGNADYKNGVIMIQDSLPLKTSDLVYVEFIKEESIKQKFLCNANPVHNKLLENDNIFFILALGQEGSTVEWVSYRDCYIKEGNLVKKIPTITGFSEALVTILPGISIGISYLDFVGTSIFAFNPLIPVIYSQAGQVVPLCTISFDKDEALGSLIKKDVRVFSDVKDDKVISSMGTNMLFSDVLKKNGLSINLNNIVKVTYDRSELNLTNESIDSIVNKTIGADLLPIVQEANIPVIRKASLKLDEYDTLTLDVECSGVYKYIHLYKATQSGTIPSNESIISSIELEPGTFINSRVETFTFIKEIDSLSIEDIAYFYVKMEDFDENLTKPSRVIQVFAQK
jgi:hypothetical protein